MTDDLTTEWTCEKCDFTNDEDAFYCRCCGQRYFDKADDLTIPEFLRTLDRSPLTPEEKERYRLKPLKQVQTRFKPGLPRSMDEGSWALLRAQEAEAKAQAKAKKKAQKQAAKDKRRQMQALNAKRKPRGGIAQMEMDLLGGIR
jgi:hypothetical protein